MILFSCSTKDRPNIPTSVNPTSDTSIITPINTDKKPSVDLDFEDFRVSFTNFSIYDAPIKSGDTLITNEEAGFSFENSLMKIEPSDNSSKYEVYLMYENSLTLLIGYQNYLDLEKWKKKSGFCLLNDSSSYYHLAPYDKDSIRREIQKDVLLIKTIALKQKGEYITKDLDTVSTISNLPVELWISKTIIKIIQTDRQGRRKIKYILNNSSYGC